MGNSGDGPAPPAAPPEPSAPPPAAGRDGPPRATAQGSLTPLRRQYLALKRRHPDAILFFRLGDFYETFDGDAELASRTLQITLTSREMGKGLRVPMAGVPYHAAEGYIARLIAAGHKVAVCEQVEAGGGSGLSQWRPPTEAPAPAKGMMAREVMRVVTPGTVVEPRMLEARRNNYLCALVAEAAPDGALRFGLAQADVTTGEFAAAELVGDEAVAELGRELDRLHPAECVVPAGQEDGAEGQAATGRNITPLDVWRFDLATARETLCRLFGVTSLAGFGCDRLPLATRAAGALVAYVEQTHRPLLALLDGLHTYEPERFVRLDGFTRRNLELIEPAPAAGGRAGAPASPAAQAAETGVRPTLLTVLDETRTAMGGRLLRRWLGQPLLDLPALRQRHDAVGCLAGDGVLRGQLRTLLGKVADVERLTNRVRQGAALPRDLLALRVSLLAGGEIGGLVSGAGAAELTPLTGATDPCADVAALIERAVFDTTGGEGKRRDATLSTWEDERLIRTGYSPALDELVQSSADARRWIAGLEGAERERTGIKGLKVGFNKVFGYYLQVSHAYKGEVPGHYIRRQTLTDGERYITPELKEYENLVLHAQERIAELERRLFGELQREIAAAASRLLATAGSLAQLDVLAGFAEVAVRRGYVRPLLEDGEALEIEAGRHPVVEAALEGATAQLGQPAAFVPNACRLDTTAEQIAIITGPNMAGKSTFLRSVALIVLLAQVGSFVPAARARIGLVDRIFTRVGAQDDLAAGQSTFMVEMVETASILRHARRKSLVILDEIGRGTSTYDGVAIAQAVVEHLHGPEAGPRTLFATHYHELAELEHSLARVRNHRVDVLEEGDRVVFLHRVVPGSAGRSYGIHVARLAGVPRAVTRRAEEVLNGLEAHRRETGAAGPPPPPPFPPAAQPAAGNGHAAVLNGSGRTGKRARGAAATTVTTLQLTLFGPAAPHPLLEELKAMDVMAMTPLEALNRLAALAERAREA
jgi:DNA mismatch repair protein MutS